MAQVIAGLTYAFPQRVGAAMRDYPRLAQLHKQAFARPRIKAYLRSKRRTPFNQHGLFRHYPELDR